jgi:hypothetical protein
MHLNDSASAATHNTNEQSAKGSLVCPNAAVFLSWKQGKGTPPAGFKTKSKPSSSAPKQCPWPDCPQRNIGHDWKPCKAKMASNTVTESSVVSCGICLSTSHTRDKCNLKAMVASALSSTASAGDFVGYIADTKSTTAVYSTISFEGNSAFEVLEDSGANRTLCPGHLASAFLAPGSVTKVTNLKAHGVGSCAIQSFGVFIGY